LTLPERKQNPGWNTVIAISATTIMLQPSSVNAPKHELDNSHGIQDDKLGLILHNWIPPSTSHLSYTVATASKDGYPSCKDGSEEKFELEAVPEVRGGRIQFMSVPVRSYKVLNAETAEN
jgi:hypothetical protein